MSKEQEKQYIYITQSSTELAVCKIGKTGDLADRLNDYNKSKTGKSNKCKR